MKIQNKRFFSAVLPEELGLSLVGAFIAGIIIAKPTITTWLFRVLPFICVYEFLLYLYGDAPELPNFYD